MKSLIEQIKFIDTILLPIYNIKNVHDYKNKICLHLLNKSIIKKLNNILNKFKKIFPIKNFNLHKTNNKILSCKHAFNFLKKCLEIAVIPFQCYITNGKKYLRLVSINKTLYKYIMETSEIRNFDEINMTDVNDIKSNENIYNGTNIINGIKKEYSYNFLVNVKNIYNKNFSIDLRKYNIGNKIIKSLKIALYSNVLSKKIIKKIIKKLKFSLVVGGNLIYDDNFDINKELIPNGMLLMNGKLNYHEVKCIINDYDNKYINFIQYLMFNIKIIYVDIYKKIMNECKNKRIEFIISKNNNFNVFVIHEGKGKNKFDNFLPLDNFDNKYTQNTCLIKKEDNLHFEEVLLGNIKGCRINIGDEYTHPLHLISPEYGYNFSIKRKEYNKTNEKEIYITCEPKITHHYDHAIIIDGDILSNYTFAFIFDKKINFDNIKIFYKCNDIKIELEYNIEGLSLIIKPIYLNLLAEKFFKHYIALEYYCDDIHFDIFGNLIIENDVIYVPENIRKKLVDNNYIITINDFEKLYE